MDGYIKLSEFNELFRWFSERMSMIILQMYTNEEEIDEEMGKLSDFMFYVQNIEQNRQSVYRERNMCVAAIVRAAIQNNWNVGYVQEQFEDGIWYIIYIDTPNGQISWHISSKEYEEYFKGICINKYNSKWDNHTNEEKYKRLHKTFK